ESAAHASGLLRTVGSEVDDAYIAQVKTLCVQPDMLRAYGDTLRIVYSPLHGSGNLPVRRVLREVGITNLLVVPEQELPDGRFPTVRVPNPEEPDAFTLAIALAHREGADAAFATDPDCDRLGVAVRNAEGVFQLLTGNQIGCLLLYYILSRRAEAGTLPQNGAVVKSIVSTELARAITDAYGVQMIDVLTGFKFIAEQIQSFEETGSHTFLFGFEESYGFLSSTFVRDKDAVNASLLVAELALYLKTQGRTLFDLLQEIYMRFGYYVERVASVSLPGKDGLSRMQTLMQALRAHPPITLGRLAVTAVRDYQTGLRTEVRGASAPMGLPASDVLYYEIEGGHWVCIRPSGTEPKVKVYVNTHADDPAAAEALAQALLSDAKGKLS
ncbi:MAG: phospho-sugar mutase, partial [Clostridia bacterium]